jgi:uncharacterized protein
MSDLNPFLLAAVTPNLDPRLLPLLRSHPSLASQQDAHGYSLLHAAASYNHVDLLKVLVTELRVDVNLKDEDGETCLFVAETLDVVKCLVEELNVDVTLRNDDEVTAAEKFESEDEYPEISAYLRQRAGGAATTSNGILPPLPPNVNIQVNSTEDVGTEQEPDPEFRRRIEELAASDNFQSEEGQAELRNLIQDAVRGVSDDRDVRRRVG